METATSGSAPRSVASAVWLRALRILWGALVAVSLLLLMRGLPAALKLLSSQCVGSSCYPAQLSPANAEGFARVGLSPEFWAGYVIVNEAFFVLTSFAVAALLVWRRPDERVALLAAVALTSFGASYTVTPVDVLALGSPVATQLLKAVQYLGAVSLVSFLYLFPDGRFVPGWARWLCAAWALVQFVAFFMPVIMNAIRPAVQGVNAVLLLTPAAMQVFRYRRVSSPAQRQQTRWVVGGLLAASILYTLDGFVLQPAAFDPASDQVAFRLVALTGWYLALALVPLSIGAAVLRDRLWGIEPIVNRTLVYAALTISVAGAYALVVVGLGALVPHGNSMLQSLIATAIIAVAFAPLRSRIQTAVNRLMYGERDDPYALISRLGQRLASALAPDAALPVLVETVKEGLRVPYVALVLVEDREDESAATNIVAAAGQPPASTTPLAEVPLIYSGTRLGYLALAPRSPEERFSLADRRLLADLARQAGVTIMAAQAQAELQRSRERLVLAREEERRRLRNDLHDDIGPRLAGLVWRLETARNRSAGSAEAQQLLGELAEQARAAVADIRRVVHNLRPPALDELGLLGALQNLAASLNHGKERLRVETVLPGRLPPLSAAVEAAAYRIAQEALANVLQHAQARECVLSLRVDEGAGTLCLEVQDDGRGQIGSTSGLGLRSMRERAEELGGTFLITAADGAGTRLRAILPLR